MGKISEPVLWGEDWESAVEKAIRKLKEVCPSYTQTMPSDPGIAILEAAIYVLDLLGMALNRLPYASLVSWLNYIGLEKKGAQPAKAILKLVFSPPLPEDLILPVGELFSTESGLLFETKQEYIIPAFTSEYKIEVFCTVAGTIGNVEANKIIHVVRPLPYLQSVTNEKPATGGADSELDEEAIERGRKILSHLWRAVNAADFEQIALSVPGVARAKIVEKVGGIELYILPERGQAFEEELKSRIWKVIEEKRIRAIPWVLKEAILKDVYVKARIKLLPGYSFPTVLKYVEEALRTYLDPYCWQWGRKIPLSELLLVIENVKGIDYVEELLLPRENVKLEQYELPRLKEVQLEIV